MKRCFTIIKLLAIIIILATLMIIAVPSILSILVMTRDSVFIT